MELQDIQNRDDIVRLVNKFYDGILNDRYMKPVFEDSLPNWDHHKERVINFWENWVFQTGNYDGGMMWRHAERHRTHPMTKELFERWLAYWITTVENMFKGERADFVVKKAIEIGNILHHKLNQM